MRPHTAGASRGQSLLEFALLAMVLIILLMGIFEFGRLWYANITVVNAARMGAEYGAQNPEAAQDVAGIQQAVRAELATLFQVDEDNPAISVLRGTDPYGQPFVSVTVTYTFRRILPVPGFPGTVRITKTSIMRVQP